MKDCPYYKNVECYDVMNNTCIGCVVYTYKHDNQSLIGETLATEAQHIIHAICHKCNNKQSLIKKIASIFFKRKKEK